MCCCCCCSMPLRRRTQLLLSIKRPAMNETRVNLWRSGFLLFWSEQLFLTLSWRQLLINGHTEPQHNMYIISSYYCALCVSCWIKSASLLAARNVLCIYLWSSSSSSNSTNQRLSVGWRESVVVVASTEIARLMTSQQQQQQRGI